MLRQMEKKLREMTEEAYLVWEWRGLLWGLQEVKRFKLPQYFFFYPPHFISSVFLKIQ